MVDTVNKVALVGFHIAVYVKDHPEAIWATFEYDNNAPTFAAKQSPNDVVSTKDFLFYKKNTLAKNCNINNSGLNSILNLHESTQTMTAVSNACLQFAQGTVGSLPNQSSASTNIESIKSLNSSVKHLMENSNWLRNYSEIGAVWFNRDDNEPSKFEPNWSPNIEPSLLIGSTRLSNSTIETFTQNWHSANECFSCHNTMAVTDTPGDIPILAGKNINTSHILLKNYLDGNAVNR